MVGQLPDGLVGSSGWFGAGLLGLVLFWLLMRHLPDKDAQMTRFITDKDAQLSAQSEAKEKRIDDQRKEFTKTLLELMLSFRAEANAERSACEKHFSTLADSMNTAFKTLGDQLSTHSQRNQQWLDLMKKQIEEHQANKPKGV